MVQTCPKGLYDAVIRQGVLIKVNDLRRHGGREILENFIGDNKKNFH